MKWTLKSAKRDSVKIWVSEDGFYKIIKRGLKFTLKRYDAFNILGEEVGTYDLLESAQKAVER